MRQKRFTGVKGWACAAFALFVLFVVTMAAQAEFDNAAELPNGQDLALIRTGLVDAEDDGEPYAKTTIYLLSCIFGAQLASILFRNIRP